MDYSKNLPDATINEYHALMVDVSTHAALPLLFSLTQEGTAHHDFTDDPPDGRFLTLEEGENHLYFLFLGNQGAVDEAKQSLQESGRFEASNIRLSSDFARSLGCNNSDPRFRDKSLQEALFQAYASLLAHRALPSSER